MSEKPSAAPPPTNLTELEMAFAKDPGSDAYKPLFEAYLAAGRHMEATVLGRKAAKAKPEDKDRKLLLARVYEVQGKLPKALEEVAAAAKADPAHLPTRLLHGKLLDKSGKKPEAIEELKAVVDLDKEHAEAKAALLALGVVYPPPPPPPPPPAPVAAAPRVRAATTTAMRSTSLTRTPVMAAAGAPAAEGAAAPAAAAGGTDVGVEDAPAPAPRPRPRARRALTEAELGIETKVEPAKQGMGKTLGLLVGGLVVIALLVVGMSFYRVRQEKLGGFAKTAKENLALDSLPALRKSLQNFEEMLKVDSGSELAVSHVAYIKAIFYAQYGVGSDKDADRAVETAEKKAEESAATHVARAMLLQKAGKVDEAFDLIKETIEKRGENAAVEVALGDAYLAKGKVEEALTAYTSARNRGPKEARPLYVSGELFRVMGREREAMGNLDSALRIDRDHAPARVSRALLRLESGTPTDVAAAQTDLTTLNERNEAMGTAYQALARVIYAEIQRINGTGDPRKELEDSKKALGATHPDLLMALGRLELDSGKPAEAIKLFRDVAKRFPYRLGAHMALIRALISNAQYGEADAAIEEAQKTQPKKNLDLAILSIVARREKRDFKGAEDAAAKANEISKDHPRIQLEQARAYSDQKKYPEALKMLGTALEHSSDERPVFMAELLTQTAATLLAKGDPALAGESLDQAQKAEPNYAPAYYWRGMVLKANPKAKDDARAAFQKYLEKAPKGELAAKATRERDAL